MAARAQHIHQAVHYLTNVHRPLVAASPGRRDLDLGQLPFRIGQISGIAQFAPAIPGAVLNASHEATAPVNDGSHQEIITYLQRST